MQPAPALDIIQKDQLVLRWSNGATEQYNLTNRADVNRLVARIRTGGFHPGPTLASPAGFGMPGFEINAYIASLHQQRGGAGVLQQLANLTGVDAQQLERVASVLVDPNAASMFADLVGEKQAQNQAPPQPPQVPSTPQQAQSPGFMGNAPARQPAPQAAQPFPAISTQQPAMGQPVQQQLNLPQVAPQQVAPVAMPQPPEFGQPAPPSGINAGPAQESGQVKTYVDAVSGERIDLPVDNALQQIEQRRGQ